MTREKTVNVQNGWFMLLLTILVFLLGLGLEIAFGRSAFVAAQTARGADVMQTAALPNFYYLFFGVLAIALGLFMCYGFFTLQPNEARVLILFGAYQGTERTSGFLGPIRFTPSGGFRCGRAT